MKEFYESVKDYKLARLEQVTLSQISMINETTKKIAQIAKATDDLSKFCDNELEKSKIVSELSNIKNNCCAQLAKLKITIELTCLLAVEMDLIDRDEESLKDSISVLKSMINSTKSSEVNSRLLEIKHSAPRAKDKISEATINELISVIDEILKA